MSNHIRVRALDEIQKDSGWKTQWKTFNALFRGFTPIFDDVFDRGSAPDLESYVDVKTTDGHLFADRLLENLIGLHHVGRHEGRVYLLQGNVGRGKSIFCRHLVQKFIPKRLPNVIAVYSDAFDMVQGTETGNSGTEKEPKTFGEFGENVKASVVSAALKSHKNIFRDECMFYRLLLRSKGYNFDSDW